MSDLWTCDRHDGLTGSRHYVCAKCVTEEAERDHTQLADLRAKLEQAQATIEKEVRQKYSSALGPCAVHDEFFPGCVRCIVKAFHQAQARERAIREALKELHVSGDVLAQELCEDEPGMVNIIKRFNVALDKAEAALAQPAPAKREP